MSAANKRAREDDGGDDNDLFTRFQINWNQRLGSGGYGDTYACKDTLTNSPAAVKVINTRKMRVDKIREECETLELLDHPHIINQMGHCAGQGDQAHLYFIFMELASGGELFNKLCDEHDTATALTEGETRRFMRQLLAGVAHCHSRGVAHLDLKLENVLLNSDDAIKIIDFGLSHRYAALEGAASALIPQANWNRSVPLRQICGSKSYAAPEVLGGVGYDGFEADMWSLGVCAFALLTGFFPLAEATADDWRFGRLQRTQQLGRSTVETVFSWYRRPTGHLSPEVIQLLDGMLTINPARRMTMQQVLDHPWITGQQPPAGLLKAWWGSAARWAGRSCGRDMHCARQRRLGCCAG